MQFRIFTIPTTDDGSVTEEMNRFLRSHKVLETEQQLVSTKSGSHWHFIITLQFSDQRKKTPNQPVVGLTSYIVCVNPKSKLLCAKENFL